MAMPRGISAGKGMTQAQLLSESGLYELILRSDEETLEVRWLDDPGAPEDWAFPRHYAAAISFFRSNA